MCTFATKIISTSIVLMYFFYGIFYLTLHLKLSRNSQDTLDSLRLVLLFFKQFLSFVSTVRAKTLFSVKILDKSTANAVIKVHDLLILKKTTLFFQETRLLKLQMSHFKKFDIFDIY